MFSSSRFSISYLACKHSKWRNDRGGTGFALLLLYDLAAIGTEVLLSALKYLANLLELSTRKDADSVGSTRQDEDNTKDKTNTPAYRQAVRARVIHSCLMHSTPLLRMVRYGIWLIP